MYFKVQGFTKAFAIWALLCLVGVSEFHPLAILAALFAGMSFFFQERIELGRNGLGIAIAGSLLLCFACTRIIDRDQTGLFLGIGTLSLAILGAILLGQSLLLKKHGVWARGPLLCSCAILVACSMSTDIRVVAVVTALGLSLMILSMREAMNLSSAAHLILPTLLTFALVATLATVLTWSESKVSYLARLFALTPHTGFSFPATSSLSSLQRWNGDDVVVLRGYGENPPLYLKGRTFTQFDNKKFWRWHTDKEELSPDDQVLVTTKEGPKAISMFAKSTDPKAEPGPYFRVEYPKGGGGFTFYAPAEHYGLAVDLGRIHRYGDGMLQALAKDHCPASYYLFPYQQGWKSDAPTEPLTPEMREQCLELPENLSPVVRDLAQEVAGKATTPDRKADFVTNFLHQNFTYGYDYPFESTETALEEFLVKRPPAHCEFFATSAALMLRAQGVPTRYINGFVMQEKSLTGGYYVVRLKHAHAWIEVFLEDRGWVAYDPTPPGTLDDPDSRAGPAEALLELVSNLWRQVTNFFSLSPLEMLQQVKAFFTAWTWFDYLKLVLLGLLWFAWKKLRSARQPKKEAPKLLDIYTPGRNDTLTPLLERVSETLEPPEWQRVETETPHQWAQRLEQSDLSQDLKDEVRDFCRLYTRLRFSDDDGPGELEQLKKQACALVESLGGKSLKARERRSDNETASG